MDKKIVLEVLGSVIEEFGFSYDAGSSDKIIWCFQREKESIKQMVIVPEHRYQKTLMLRFTTSKLRARVVDDIDIVPEHKYSNKLFGWSYDGEKEFRDNLLQLADVVKCYGLKVLDELSAEEETEPTAEMGEKLLTSYEALSEKFAKENMLFTKPSKENILTWFDV